MDNAYLITRNDLEAFRSEILSAIRDGANQQNLIPELLKSSDVRRILKCSHATLQTLRSNGTLPFSKVNGTMYYRTEDLRDMLNKNRNSDHC